MAGTVTFSIEVELGWGVVQYDNLGALSPDRRAESQALEQLLDLCDELEIPMTFNVVGHLLRDGRLDSYDGGHEDGWFDDIPESDADLAPLFFAPDLIRRIQDASVNHEICTHTFTHVECGNVTPETLRWEFDRVLETHDMFGLNRPVSLVPPRHSPPPRDVLREYDIGIVRSSRARAPDLQDATNDLQLAWDILRGKMPVIQPRLVDGVVETYCTRYPSLTAPFLPSGQQSAHPAFRTLPRSLRQKLHLHNLRGNLSTVNERDPYLHYWTHLWELANQHQWPQVHQFLTEVSNSRSNEGLQVKTMAELNRDIRS